MTSVTPRVTPFPAQIYDSDKELLDVAGAPVPTLRVHAHRAVPLTAGCCCLSPAAAPLFSRAPRGRGSEACPRPHAVTRARTERTTHYRHDLGLPEERGASLDTARSLATVKEKRRMDSGYRVISPVTSGTR